MISVCDIIRTRTAKIGSDESIPSDLYEITTLPEFIPESPENISLDGGCDGLSCYKEIARNAKKHVNKNSKICLEIGLGQSNSVTKIFDRYCFKLILEEKDLQGINRVVVYKLK